MQSICIFKVEKATKGGPFSLKANYTSDSRGETTSNTSSKSKNKYVETNEFIFAFADIVCWNCQIAKKYKFFSSLGRWNTGKMSFLKKNYFKDFLGKPNTHFINFGLKD